MCKRATDVLEGSFTETERNSGRFGEPRSCRVMVGGSLSVRLPKDFYLKSFDATKLELTREREIMRLMLLYMWHRG